MKTVRKIFGVFGVFVLAALGELGTTFLLGRNLSPQDFGKYKFIHTLVLFFSGVFMLGRNYALIRVLRRDGGDRYDWKGFLKSSGGYSLGGIALAVLIAAYYYRLFSAGWIILFSAGSAVGIELFSSVLRAQGRFRDSVIIAKTPGFLFCGAVFVCVGLLHIRHAVPVLICYAAAYTGAAGIGWYAVRKIACGRCSFPRRAVRDGLWLFLLTITFMTTLQADQFFIVRLLGYGQFAGYAAVTALMRGFELVALAVWFVLTPLYSRDPTRSVGADTLRSLPVATALAAGYALCGGFLLHLVFNGRYDSAVPLIGWFSLSGICRVLYAAPSGFIDGRIPVRYLKQFFLLGMGGIVLQLMLNFYCIPRWGLIGAAAATGCAWTVRLISAGIVVMNYRRDTGTQAVSVAP